MADFFQTALDVLDDLYLRVGQGETMLFASWPKAAEACRIFF